MRRGGERPYARATVTAPASVSTLAPAPSFVPVTSSVSQILPPLPNQQLNLLTFARSGLGAGTFPPLAQTAAGAAFPPLAAESGALLAATLPTNQPVVEVSPITHATVSAPGLPAAPGQNQFAAVYGPQIYAVFLNGLIAQTAVTASPPPPIGSHMSVNDPVAAAKTVASLAALAGTGAILSSAPARTAAASTAAAPTPAAPPVRSPQPAAHS